MSPAPAILLLPNAGPGVGGGHVLRSLSLARALVARGARCVIAAPALGPALVARYGDGTIEALAARSGREAATICAGSRPDAVVFDHYGLSAAEEASFAAPGRVLMALDDLADRPHACDLLLDPSYGRAPADYRGHAVDGVRLLLGPDYALLRPEFAVRREVALAPVRERVERVFVSFGLSDVGGIAARALRLIRDADAEVAIDVALAGDAQSLAVLRAVAEADPRLALHVDAQDVAGLIAAADVAVGAGGSATWERACLGAPTLAVIVADNQRALIRDLDAAGALFSCDLASGDFGVGFLAAFSRLQAPDLRARLRETSRALCDGHGARRAADALLSTLADKR